MNTNPLKNNWLGNLVYSLNYFSDTLNKVEEIINSKDLPEKEADEIINILGETEEMMYTIFSDMSFKECQESSKWHSNKTVRKLKAKVSLIKSREISDLVTQKINTAIEKGIKYIVTQLDSNENNQLNSKDTSINQLSSQERMMRQLIQEEKAEKKIKQALQQQRSHKNQKSKKKQVYQKKSNQLDRASSLKISSPFVPEEIPLNTRLSNFSLKILDNSFHCIEHKRINRWKTLNIDLIRHFTDIDSNGKIIERYKLLDEREVVEQRARHYLPGIERLTKNSDYKAIYTFPTNRGFGLVAQLNVNNLTQNGIVYLGMDKSQIIFHKYFEDVDFNQPTNEIFLDKQVFAEQKEEHDVREDWSTKREFLLDISEKGFLKFDYTSHFIRIFPIQADLFKTIILKG